MRSQVGSDQGCGPGRVRRWLQVGVVVGVALIGVAPMPAAMAAAAPTADENATANDSANVLQEVVVTAEKREATVQDTPISITAITGADLQARGVSDLVSVAQQVPGVSFKTSGPGQTELEMRGLTSTGGESPTVGFYLDETSLTPPAMAQNGKVVIDPNLFDLNRVEVLRGPQGTLYGAGSMGGTIKLVTNTPDPRQLGANVELIGSGTDGGGFNHTENGMLNLPLVQDYAAVRLVLTDKHISGWIDRDVLFPFPTEVDNSTQRGNVAAAPVVQRFSESNSEELKGGRVSLLVQPSERLSVTAGFLYQRITQDGPNTIDVPPGNEVHYQPFDVSEPFKDTFNLGDLTIKYDFDSFQVVSASSTWTRQENQTQDISEAMQDYIGGFLGPPANFSFYTADGGLGPGSISEDDYTRQVSEELRVASTGNTALQWLLGGYYSSFHATSHVFSFYDGFAPLFGTNNLADNHRLLDIDQYALFGEVSYLLPANLKATAGARYFLYHSDSATSVSGISANGTSATLFGGAQNSGATPKLSLAYLPDERTNLYATIAKGFRPGGPNSPIPPPCTPAPKQFGPDSVWSYEMGEKLKMLDSRLSLNSDVYYEDWSNLQQQVAPGCGYKFTTNAGKARVYGAEMEAAVVIVPGLLFTQNFGYTHATNATTVKEAGVTSGDRLLDVPEVTANTSLTYRHLLVNNLNLMMRVNNSYIDSIQDITFTRNTLPSYDLTDARIGIESDRWSVAAFVDNLANKKALLSDTGALSANISILNRVATNQPRTIGADLTYRF
ncbi:MAG TPA: TonB-dependent receptor [Steroidobacteraceae bacterium]|nr:TonB-dependent receptor [Steroidobacteraceae bacterium]